MNIDDKAIPKWNTGHFPVGTVCEAILSSDIPFTFTVKGIVRNGIRSYVLKTDLISPIVGLDYRCFNIDHVTRIIKRGDGRVVAESNFDNFGSYFAEDQKRNQGAFGITKHKSQYLTFGNTQGLIMNVAYKYCPPEATLDMEKLTKKLLEQNVIRNEYVLGEYRLNYVKCNKKKLHKAVKRLINKCLTPLKAAEATERKFYDDMDENDCWAEYDNNYITPIDLGELDLPNDSYRASED